MYEGSVRYCSGILLHLVAVLWYQVQSSQPTNLIPAALLPRLFDLRFVVFKFATPSFLCFLEPNNTPPLLLCGLRKSPQPKDANRRISTRSTHERGEHRDELTSSLLTAYLLRLGIASGGPLVLISGTRSPHGRLSRVVCGERGAATWVPECAGVGVARGAYDVVRVAIVGWVSR